MNVRQARPGARVVYNAITLEFGIILRRHEARHVLVEWDSGHKSLFPISLLQLIDSPETEALFVLSKL